MPPDAKLETRSRASSTTADIGLLAEHEPTSTDSPRKPERASLNAAVRGWLIAPMMLAATVCGALLVLNGVDRMFSIALSLSIGIALAWILVSVFFPARAERRCPECGRNALRRLDRDSMRGLECDCCGYVDAQASSFLLAEEDGVALEPLILSARVRAPSEAREPRRNEVVGGRPSRPERRS